MSVPIHVVAIDEAIASGATIDDIDERIIANAPISEDQRAALWLYAWSGYPNYHQRQTAVTMLAVVGD